MVRTLGPSLRIDFIKLIPWLAIPFAFDTLLILQGLVQMSSVRLSLRRISILFPPPFSNGHSTFTLPCLAVCFCVGAHCLHVIDRTLLQARGHASLICTPPAPDSQWAGKKRQCCEQKFQAEDLSLRGPRIHCERSGVLVTHTVSERHPTPGLLYHMVWRREVLKRAVGGEPGQARVRTESPLSSGCRDKAAWKTAGRLFGDPPVRVAPMSGTPSVHLGEVGSYPVTSWQGTAGVSETRTLV